MVSVNPVKILGNTVGDRTRNLISHDNRYRFTGLAYDGFVLIPIEPELCNSLLHNSYKPNLASNDVCCVAPWRPAPDQS